MMTASVNKVCPDNLSLVIDVIGNGLPAPWEVDCRIGPVVVKEAVFVDEVVDLTIPVKPGDLAFVVDAGSMRVDRTWGINGRVGCHALPL
jgi:hypothetical protein